MARLRTAYKCLVYGLKGGARHGGGRCVVPFAGGGPGFRLGWNECKASEVRNGKVSNLIARGRAQTNEPLR